MARVSPARPRPDSHSTVKRNNFGTGRSRRIPRHSKHNKVRRRPSARRGARERTRGRRKTREHTTEERERESGREKIIKWPDPYPGGRSAPPRRRKQGERVSAARRPAAPLAHASAGRAARRYGGLGGRGSTGPAHESARPDAPTPRPATPRPAPPGLALPRCRQRTGSPGPQPPPAAPPGSARFIVVFFAVGVTR